MDVRQMMQKSEPPTPTKAFCRECNAMVPITRHYCGHYYVAKQHMLGFDWLLASGISNNAYAINRWSNDCKTIVPVKSE
jgi:hypothetical protein